MGPFKGAVRNGVRAVEEGKRANNEHSHTRSGGLAVFSLIGLYVLDVGLQVFHLILCVEVPE